MTLQYRAVEKEDFHTISTFASNEQEAYYFFPKGSAFPIHSDQLQELANTRIRPTVIVSDNQVIGYSNFYDLAEGSHCWLGNVIISPTYRGTGTGKYLIETMKQIAKEELNLKHINLVCHNTNTKALRFYYRLGFIPFGLKEMIDYSGNNIMGIQLTLKL